MVQGMKSHMAWFSFLFFHCADIVSHLQPVELWTKCGRRGRVKEPVGTHGKLMKKIKVSFLAKINCECPRHVKDIRKY